MEVKEMKTELVFDNFRQPFFKVLCTFKDGCQVQKTLSHEEYQRLIGMAVREAPAAFVELPKYPENFYKGGISASGEKDTFWVSFVIPKFTGQYLWTPTNELLMVPYPSLFFAINVRKGIIRRKFCYALAEADVNDRTPLYQYPYGNVGNDGSICMGNCMTDDIGFEKSYRFVESFLIGKNSGHYYSSGKMAKPDIPLRKLLELVIKKGSFPKAWLMPCFSTNDTPVKEQVTIGEIIRKIQL